MLGGIKIPRGPEAPITAAVNDFLYPNSSISGAITFPIAAAVAHKLAVENSMVKADVIDINEFPYLSQKYAVMGVPKIIINEKVEFTGSFNEDLFAEHVLLGAY